VLHKSLGAGLLVLLAVAVLGAEEIKGKLKSVDAAKNLLVVTVGDRERSFTVGDDSKIVGGDDKEIKSRLKSKAFKAGATVRITTATKDGKEVIALVKVGDPPKPPPVAFTDPEKAGVDFTIQGEYEGTIAGKDRLAAQVVALGDGKFDVYFLRGGLPGAGWDGKTRSKAAAELDRDAKGAASARVSGGDWSGVCVPTGTPAFRGKTPRDEEFTLNHVLRKSPTEASKPPDGAVILFDGTGADEWNGGKLVEGNLLDRGPTSKKTFRDFKLHVEFRLPFVPAARGQNRANSGVYLQNRYEIQVLDSFGLDGKNNECGGIYEQTAPAVNLCYPPLSWQTYDVEFRMARFDASGKKTANAVVTVLHNGFKVHDKVEIPKQTGHGQPEKDTAEPISLQSHGSPVVFRNIWIVPLKE
jgi:hypothetical protein